MAARSRPRPRAETPESLERSQLAELMRYTGDYDSSILHNNITNTTLLAKSRAASPLWTLMYEMTGVGGILSFRVFFGCLQFSQKPFAFHSNRSFFISYLKDPSLTPFSHDVSLVKLACRFLFLLFFQRHCAIIVRSPRREFKEYNTSNPFFRL